MNTRLLRKVQRKILAEPKQFQMRTWFTSDLDHKIPNCGTAACIGGWALVLSRKAKPSALQLIPSPFELIREALNLPYWQASLLCVFRQWPVKFQRYGEDNAKQAARRIEHFIKTGGEE